MIEEIYPGEVRPDTVIISPDEYADLVRAAAMLDAIVIMAVNSGSKNPLYLTIAKERNLVRPED